MRRLERLLMYAGTAAVVLALSKYHADAVGRYDFTSSDRFGWAIAYIVVLCLGAYSAGLPDLGGGWKASMFWSAAVGGIASLVVSASQLLAGSLLLPRFVVFGSALLLVAYYPALDLLAAGSRSRREERLRILLVADPEEAASLSEDLAMRPEHPASVAVALTARAAARTDDGDEPLRRSANEHRVTMVVLDRAGQADHSVVAQAAELHERGVRVRTLSMFYEEWLGKLPLTELERVSLLFDIGELHGGGQYLRLKRVMDVTAGVLGGLVLLVAIPFVVAGDLVANRGPLFFVQPRVGRNGEVFRIFKFRTMMPSGGAPSNEWTTEDDPRITPFGRLLRRTHLDELPQVLNILFGPLSIVGPRPEQPHYVAELVEKIPFYDVRHHVKPGLTGWAQVKYGYAGTERDAIQKLQYDFYYLRHQSLRLDARVIGRTLRSVMRAGGR